MQITGKQTYYTSITIKKGHVLLENKVQANNDHKERYDKIKNTILYWNGTHSELVCGPSWACRL